MLTILLFLVNLPNCWGWSEHHVLTRKSLKNVEQLQNVKVEVTEWNNLLKDLGYESSAAFNTAIQIRKDFAFKPQLEEKAGSKLEIIDVLAKYSDEPDWQMETQLFDDGQYPELWKSEYQFMGGKLGTPSQSFRHMYWRPFSFMNPLATFKMPVTHLFKSMGTAPDRAELFLNLSRKALEACHQYWGIRFMGVGLHYLEDVSSPFHATQTPTKKFIMMPFTEKMGVGKKDFVLQVQNIVAYYHFSFEDYIGRIILDSETGVVNSATKDFSQMLEQANKGYYDGNVKQLVLAMSQLALSQSADSARASIEFFPPMTEPFDTIQPQKFMDENWWKETLLRGTAETPAKDKYFQTVRTMFRPLGEAIRALVTYETENAGKKCDINH